MLRASGTHTNVPGAAGILPWAPYAPSSPGRPLPSEPINARRPLAERGQGAEGRGLGSSSSLLGLWHRIEPEWQPVGKNAPLSNRVRFPSPGGERRAGSLRRGGRAASGCRGVGVSAARPLGYRCCWTRAGHAGASLVSLLRVGGSETSSGTANASDSVDEKYFIPTKSTSFKNAQGPNATRFSAPDKQLFGQESLVSISVRSYPQTCLFLPFF